MKNYYEDLFKKIYHEARSGLNKSHDESCEAAFDAVDMAKKESLNKIVELVKDLSKETKFRQFFKYLIGAKEEEEFFCEIIKEVIALNEKEEEKASEKKESKKEEKPQEETSTKNITDVITSIMSSPDIIKAITSLANAATDNTKKAAFTETAKTKDDIEYLKSHMVDIEKFAKYKPDTPGYNKTIQRFTEFCKTMEKNNIIIKDAKIVDSFWRGYYDCVLSVPNESTTIYYWLTKDKLSKENNTNVYEGDEGAAQMKSDIETYRQPPKKEKGSIAA